jgi:branched-chain amino acid aminotransferase
VSAWVSTAGGLIESEAASISIFDHGITVGDGVFETVLVREGQPIALTRHLRRLERSCLILGLAFPGREAVLAAVDAVIASEERAKVLGRMRITVTGGRGPLASDRGGQAPTWIVALAETEPWPGTTSAIVVPWRRNEFSPVSGAKTTSYVENVVAMQWARDQGYSEGIFLNTRGALCEGASTNVFVVIGGNLFTPPLMSGCLAGVTRELVLEWTDAQERDLTEVDLVNADEIFLTSSTRDVHPVVRLGSTWARAGVGPVTAATQETVAARIQADPDPK